MSEVQPDWVCAPCGGEYGYRQPVEAEWHHGHCGVCSRPALVAEAGEFGYLRAGWVTAMVFHGCG